ncbi:hypothetical protein [Jiangella asiatica]|nr:hypothetical protein [Jiangella asiatica]
MPLSRTIARLRPLARLRRWLIGPHQPTTSIRLSAALVSLLALLALTIR